MYSGEVSGFCRQVRSPSTNADRTAQMLLNYKFKSRVKKGWFFHTF